MLEYKFVLRSNTLELNKYDDPEPSFKRLISIVKAFAGIFDFKVNRIEPFWGEETEGNWDYCQTGYTFELVKRFPGSQMYLVSAAIFCLTNQHSLKVEKEDLYSVRQGKDDED